MRRSLHVLACVVVVMATAGCGSSGASDRVPRTVPSGLVPERTATGDLQFVPYDDPEVEDAFAPTGASSLADDAVVWEVRDGDLLVGALQIVALAPRVDPADDDDRRSVVNQAILGAPDRFDVEGVEIYAGESGARRLFVWFSEQLFVFLQLKEEGGLDAERVVTELIRHQVALDAWKSLPPLLEEDF